MISIYDVLKASKGIHVDDTFAELWGRKLSNAYTVTTYTGTLPATLRTVAGYLESYRIYGNTVQDGTPTPENPIVPTRCGERTENLFDKSKRTDNVRVLSTTGEINTLPDVFVSDFTPIEPTTTYTLNLVSSISGKTGHLFALYDENKDFIDTGTHVATTATVYTFTTPSNVVYIRFNGNISSVDEITLTLGATAPASYIPYGYKLPLTVNGVEYPIFLGESQATRRIKKLVLTGEEDWSRQSASHTTCINLYTAITSAKPSGMIISNVATYNSNAGLSNDSLVNVGRINNIGTNLLMDMELSKFATASAWKTYLREQYANGTPVTVWYVLAEPETGIVNGPLMKIGDYTDTIDSTQTTVQIPTAAGETTISWAGEGLAPSEVELTYRKRKG